jgi:hypothetical protein
VPGSRDLEGRSGTRAEIDEAVGGLLPERENLLVESADPKLREASDFVRRLVDAFRKKNGVEDPLGHTIGKRICGVVGAPCVGRAIGEFPEQHLGGQDRLIRVGGPARGMERKGQRDPEKASTHEQTMADGRGFGKPAKWD